MRNMRTSHVAPAVLVLASAAVLAAQEAQKPAAPPPSETPTFPAQVEQVIVDVVVTDKKGNPIKGLTKADLSVSEDGTGEEGEEGGGDRGLSHGPHGSFTQTCPFSTFTS